METYRSFVDIKFPGSAYDLVDQLKQAHRANLKPNTCQPLGLLEGKALDVVTFEEICPSPSARMVDEFAGVIFARMGEGRSDCGEWTVTMEVEIVHFHRLVAFVTYQGYEDQSSVIMKLESVAAVSYHHGNACIGSETNTPKLEWTDGSRSRLLDCEDSENLRQCIFDMPAASREDPIRARITLSTRLFLQRRCPLDSLSHDLLRMITSNLLLPDVIHLAQAIPKLRPFLLDTPGVRLGALLRPYFSKLGAFGQMLQKTGAIIGGSTVLKAFQPCEWVPGDLDLVVPAVFHGTLVGFLKAEGYVEDEAKSNTPEYPIAEPVPFFYKQFVRGERRIDVSGISQMTPVDFILTYHCTAPMNYCDGTTIVCLFPSLTFKHLFRLNGFTHTERLEHGIKKYVDRGSSKHSSEAAIQQLFGVKPEEQVKRPMLKKVWRTRAVLVD